MDRIYNEQKLKVQIILEVFTEKWKTSASEKLQKSKCNKKLKQSKNPPPQAK